MNRSALAALLNRPSTWALLDQALVSAANFVTMLVVARLLSVADFAQYSLAFLTALFLSNLQRSLFTQPLNILGAVEAPQALYQRYRSILSLHAPAALAIVCAVGGIGWFFYPNPWVILSASAYVLMFLLQEVVRRLHYTRSDIRTAFANDALGYGLQLITLCLIWALHLRDAAWIFVGFAISFGLAFAWGHWHIQRSAPDIQASAPSGRDKQLLSEHWHFAKWIVLSQFVYWGSSQLYPFQLAKFVSVESVADFSAANAILNALNVVRLMLGNYLPSRAALVYAHNGVSGLLSYLKRVLMIYGLITVVMTLGLIWGSDWLIDALFGGKYQGAKELLPYFAVVNALVIIGVVVNTGAMVLKATDWIFYANSAGTAFSILVGPVLLMKFGVWGAVIGFGVGTLLPALIQGIHLLWHAGRIQHSKLA